MQNDLSGQWQWQSEYGSPGPQSKKKDSPAVLILVGLACVGLGIMFLSLLVQTAWKGLASLTWEKAEGIIVRTGLDKSWYSTRGGQQYSLQVVYRYTVDGKEYQNDRISFFETRGGGSEDYYQQQLDTKYPRNCPHVVYYNPSNPAESCLEPGANYFYLTLGLVILPLVIFGGSLCIRQGLRGLEETKNRGRTADGNSPPQ